jgi:hypothetical protein
VNIADEATFWQAKGDKSAEKVRRVCLFPFIGQLLLQLVPGQPDLLDSPQGIVARLAVPPGTADPKAAASKL